MTLATIYERDEKLRDRPRLYTILGCPKTGKIRVRTLSMMDFDFLTKVRKGMKTIIRNDS